MNSKLAKQIRKKVDKQSDKIKVQGLKEFIDYSKKQSFARRFRIAVKILFKLRLNI